MSIPEEILLTHMVDQKCRAAVALGSAGSSSASCPKGFCVTPFRDSDMVWLASVSSAPSGVPSSSYLSSEEFAAAVSEFLGKLSG